MKRLLALCLAAGTAGAQPIPPEKGSQPDWDSGVPIEGAFNRCRNCHDRNSSFEETLYMPFDGWVGTMMGNSQRDPLFRVALAVANQDVPDIGQWCLRCHSPQAYLKGHVLPADGGGLDEVDLEGVTCDVCHRSTVPATEPGAPFVGNAQLYFDTTVKKFGPYPNVFSAAHEGEQSAFTGSSELCGQCHSVHNPIGTWRSLDGGMIGPRFPLDTTYEEWKQSRFSSDAGFRSCVNCHMPRFTGPDGGNSYKIAKLGDLHPNPRQHVLAGGNVWGLDAVQAANPALASEFAEQFALTRKFTLENLKGAAALTLTVPATAEAGKTTNVTVRVTNLTGHKLPTGYGDGRRVVVQLLVDGVVVTGGFDAGALLPDSQSRVYEVLHGRGGVVGEHLALHDTVVKDSRIPPAGLAPSASTRPVGVTWFAHSDGGVRDYDESSFAVPVGASLGGTRIKLTARLLYQSTTPEYVGFLATENRTNDAGRQLLEIYNATGRGAPIEMAIAEGTIEVSPSMSGAGGGSGGGNPPAPIKPCGCNATPTGIVGLLALLVGQLRRRVRT